MPFDPNGEWFNADTGAYELSPDQIALNEIENARLQEWYKTPAGRNEWLHGLALAGHASNSVRMNTSEGGGFFADVIGDFQRLFTEVPILTIPASGIVAGINSGMLMTDVPFDPFAEGTLDVSLAPESTAWPDDIAWPDETPETTFPDVPVSAIQTAVKAVASLMGFQQAQEQSARMGSLSVPRVQSVSGGAMPFPRRDVSSVGEFRNPLMPNLPPQSPKSFSEISYFLPWLIGAAIAIFLAFIFLRKG